jgi:dTDP-glucose 4,6-dehydratase
MKILVTGGSGFIGSALVRHLILDLHWQVVNVDKLTYAANPEALASVEGHPHYAFEHLDICEISALREVFACYRPDALIHLAAESHVDRSIDTPSIFMQTNIMGTHALLEVCRDYITSVAPDGFRFLHVSTDEVYGELGSVGEFLESSPYRPNSPYSASKASSDFLVRAWHQTYGLPTLQTNCSNNYGPWQHEEKLIPRMISFAVAGQSLPVFGSGRQVRDWIHVDDHVRALVHVLQHGEVGETYNIGSRCEKTNLEVVETICGILDETVADKPDGICRFEELIQHVTDRPGHDFRYALNTEKINALGWHPQIFFDDGLRKLVESMSAEGRS